MHLTSSALSDMIKTLRSNASTGMDKRRRPRVGVRMKARMIPPVEEGKEKEILTISVRDVSPGGIGFTTSRELKRGERFTLIVADDKPKAMACEVKYCRRVASNVYQIGASFVPRSSAK